MTVATQERLDTSSRIHRNHPVREAFARRSSGRGGRDYYETKGHAIYAFGDALVAYNLSFNYDDCIDFDGDEGWKTVRVLNVYDVCVGYARLAWYRVPSGRWEFTGYIS